MIKVVMFQDLLYDCFCLFVILTSVNYEHDKGVNVTHTRARACTHTHTKIMIGIAYLYHPFNIYSIRQTSRKTNIN